MARKTLEGRLRAAAGVTLRPELPAFDEAGNLPYGDYEPTEQQFVERFVDVRFREHPGEGPQGARRKELCERWLRYLGQLSARLPNDCDVVLGGSYVTAKPNPQDVDMLLEVPADDVEDMCNKSREVLGSKEERKESRCSPIPIYCLPRNDPFYTNVTEKLIKNCVPFFHMDRLGRKKGCVWATVSGFRQT